MKVCLWLVILCLSAVDGAVIDPNVQNVSPQSNSTVADLRGPTSISFNCDTFETIGGNVTQVTTAWFYRVPDIPNLVIVDPNDADQGEVVIGGTVRNDGGPFPTFRNMLTIVNMTDRLDGRILFCGHSYQGAQQLAFWSLRLYRPPLLRQDEVIKVAELDMNIPIDLESLPAAYPTPTSYQWTKDGVSVLSDQRVEYGYPRVLFRSLTRADSGVYVLTATNQRSDNGQEVGTDNGSFTLDVLYGPQLTPGPVFYAVLVGDPLVLVCGTELDSNPVSEVVWRDPSAAIVSEDQRFTLNGGPEVVSLELAFTEAADSGVWYCDVTVEDSDVLVASQGVLVPKDNPVIGSYTTAINVTVIVPPSEPRQVEAQSGDIGSTSVTLSWRAPASLGHPGVTAYRVTARDGSNPDIVYTSSDSATVQSISGLLPGVEYEVTVQAVTRAGGVEGASNASQPFYFNTTTTVPAPVCENVQSLDGNVILHWSFTHIGGLTLTTLNISYYYYEGINQVFGPMTPVTFDLRDFSVNGLTTGLMYTFSVTAANLVGVATVECSPVNHLIGVPGDPKQPTLRVVSATSVELRLETTSAGVNSDEEFYYDVMYTRFPESRTVNQSYLVPGGVAVTRTIGGLEQGVIYIFRVSARNRFGASTIVTSEPVNLNGTVAPNPPTMSTVPIGAVVGGALGGVLVVVLVILLTVIVVLLCVRCREGASYQVYSKKARNRVESTSGVKVEEVPVDIGLELQGDNKELHYADLDTFSPPSVTHKSATPTNEDRVEYATIDTFKQPEAVNGQSSNV